MNEEWFGDATGQVEFTRRRVGLADADDGYLPVLELSADGGRIILYLGTLQYLWGVPDAVLHVVPGKPL